MFDLPRADVTLKNHCVDFPRKQKKRKSANNIGDREIFWLLYIPFSCSPASSPTLFGSSHSNSRPLWVIRKGEIPAELWLKSRLLWQVESFRWPRGIRRVLSRDFAKLSLFFFFFLDEWKRTRCRTGTVSRRNRNLRNMYRGFLWQKKKIRRILSTISLILFSFYRSTSFTPKKRGLKKRVLSFDREENFSDLLVARRSTNISFRRDKNSKDSLYGFAIFFIWKPNSPVLFQTENGPGKKYRDLFLTRKKSPLYRSFI